MINPSLLAYNIALELKIFNIPQVAVKTSPKDETR